MKLKILPLLIGAVALAGCATTTMYTPDGYLTQYGADQTDADMKAVLDDCNSRFERTDSAKYVCGRKLIPLFMRYTPEFAELYAASNERARVIALGFEAGNISHETTIKTLNDVAAEYDLNNKILVEQYRKLIESRNAREQELARQRMAQALSQAGAALIVSSDDDFDTVTCTETHPGTVTCRSD